jgi:hypothetical protein
MGQCTDMCVYCVLMCVDLLVCLCHVIGISSHSEVFVEVRDIVFFFQ